MNPQDKNEFEMLLSHVRIPVERYIHFRIALVSLIKSVVVRKNRWAFLIHKSHDSL